MIRIFCALVLVIIIPTVCSSQVTFTKGYYITKNDTLKGFVEERESYFGKSFKFKKFINDDAIMIDREKIHSIHLTDLYEEYIQRMVDIDEKPIETDKLEQTISKKIVSESAFLRYIVKGKVSLLKYKDNNSKVHFFYKKDEEVKELNFVRYQTENYKIIEFEEYKQQLKNLLGECTLNPKSVTFTEKSFTDFFFRLNQCLDPKAESKKNGFVSQKVKFIAIVGLASNSLDYNGNDNIFDIVSRSKFQNSTNITAGLGIDFANKKSKPTAFGIEVLWRNLGQYNSSLDEVAFGLNSVNISATSVNTNLTFKYSFLRDKFIQPYVKASIGASYLLSLKSDFEYNKSTASRIKREPLISLSSIGYSINGGVGLSIKSIIIEARMERFSHGTSNGILGIFNANSLHFIVGYKF